MAIKLFGPNEVMSYKEYVSLILRGLGYKNSIDFTWDNIGTTKKSNK